jgi:hypothetical protein
MKRWKIRILGLLVTSFVMMTVICVQAENLLTNPIPDSGVCNRACLIGVIDNYLDALVAHDPSLLHNVSGSLKYVVNGVETQLGDDLWQTAINVDNKKRLDFADPVTGNVTTQVVIYEPNPNAGGEDTAEGATGGCGANTGETKPVIYQVRLKVAQGQITEIEAMTVRRKNAANGFFLIPTMKPRPIFLKDPAKVAQNGPASREELIEMLDRYINYLNFKKDESLVTPVFAEGCIRFENGIPTAIGPRMFEMQDRWFFNATATSMVVDEEQGIVWVMLPFFSNWNFTLVVGEAFKVYDGQIHMIQAVMNWQPNYKWD